MYTGQFEYVKWNPERKSIISYFNKQVYRRNNCVFGLIVGKPGSGKSWTSLSLACLQNPDFELNGNFYFLPSKMMKDIGKYYGVGGPRKRGKIWILDEAGVGINNKEYFSEINRGFGTFFQTARHRNPISFITVPRQNLIDSTVRKLMTIRITATGFNAERQKTIVQPRLMEYNDDFDKFYYKMLRMLKDKRMFAVNLVELPKPPKHIIDEYEKLKTEYTTDKYNEIAMSLEKYEDKQKAKYDEIANYTGQQSAIINLLNKKFTIKDIAENLEISNQAVYDHMKALRNKGVQIVPHRGDGKKVDYYEVVDPRVIEKAEEIEAIVRLGPPIPNSS